MNELDKKLSSKREKIRLKREKLALHKLHELERKRLDNEERKKKKILENESVSRVDDLVQNPGSEMVKNSILKIAIEESTETPCSSQTDSNQIESSKNKNNAEMIKNKIPRRKSASRVNDSVQCPEPEIINNSLPKRIREELSEISCSSQIDLNETENRENKSTPAVNKTVISTPAQKCNNENLIKVKSELRSCWKSKYYRAKRDKEKSDPLLENVKKIEAKGENAVRERLLFCEVLEKNLMDKKQEMKTPKQKSVFSQILAGKIVKKYKKRKEFNSLISKKTLLKYENQTQLITKVVMKKRNELTNQIKKNVQNFLEMDENSAIAPGVKDTITKNKIKKRKRFLLDTVDNLFKKFTQSTSMKISRATFYRYKPFWIVTRKASDRDTCMCKIHANFKFLVNQLTFLKLVNDASTESFIKSRVCDIINKDCNYGNCPKCVNKSMEIVDSDDATSYFKWVRKSETRKGLKNKMYEVKLVVKNKILCSVKELIVAANLEIPEFLKHAYNTGHQHRAIEIIRENLDYNSAFIVMDFSENYTCKYAEEIQAVHFGASKKQLSLHTGAIFFKDSSRSISCATFCTVSEWLNHDSAAIWSHLEPILKLLKELVPNVSSIHFQSNGPSTQYKNKTSFYLFHSHCQDLKLQSASWNFTTSGHGKSVADGVGGNVKGLCDRAVAHGKDVLSPKDVIDAVTSNPSSKIKMYVVDRNEKMETAVKNKSNLKAAPHSNQILQLTYSREQTEILRLNYLSCSYCVVNNLGMFPCAHFSLTPNVWYPEGKSTDEDTTNFKEKEVETCSVSIKETKKIKKEIQINKNKVQNKMVTENQNHSSQKSKRPIRLCRQKR